MKFDSTVRKLGGAAALTLLLVPFGACDGTTGSANDTSTAADAAAVDTSSGPDAAAADTQVDVGVDSGAPDADALAGDVGSADAADAGSDASGCSAIAGHLCDSDDDCTGGQTCGGVPAGQPCAARVCAGEPARGMLACDGGVPRREWGCCSDDECTDGGQGSCVDFMLAHCGGAPPPEINTCRYDACQVDADCGAGEACLPAGAFGTVTNTCVEAACMAHADCDAGSGGFCSLLYSDQTCGQPLLGCTYGASGCRHVHDCPNGELCIPNASRDDATCQENLPAP